MLSIIIVTDVAAVFEQVWRRQQSEVVIRKYNFTFQRAFLNYSRLIRLKNVRHKFAHTETSCKCTKIHNTARSHKLTCRSRKLKTLPHIQRSQNSFTMWNMRPNLKHVQESLKNIQKYVNLWRPCRCRHRGWSRHTRNIFSKRCFLRERYSL